MKREKIAVWVLYAVLAMLAAWFVLYQSGVIGSARDPVWTGIVVEGVLYRQVADSNIDSGDRGIQIGKIVDGEGHTLQVYEVKGYPEREYLMGRWKRESYVYQRAEELG